MSVTYLQKSSNSNSPNSGKYLVSCQNRITSENPTTAEWLDIIKQLKPTNFKDTNKILLGVLEKRKNVVIKISNSERFFHEYYIGEILQKYNIPGFIKYICKFNCNDDYTLYPKKSAHICSSPGDEMKVIVMPYYSYGNFKLYKWTPDKYITLKTAALHIIASLLQAYDVAHIIHNDIHLQNVLLAPTAKKTIVYTIDGHTIELPTYGVRIIIMDFENAFHIKGNYSQGWPIVWNDIKKVLVSLSLEIIDIPNMFQIIAEIEKMDKTPLTILQAITKMFETLVIKEKVPVYIVHKDGPSYNIK
jgi:serine/threonine protein kinase